MSTFRRLAVLATSLAAGLVAVPTAHAVEAGLNISAYADATVALDKGAAQVRFFVPWKNFEPDDADQFTARGPKDQRPSDLTWSLKENVDRVRARGATPIMVVLDAPGWAGAGTGEHLHPRDTEARAAYARFMGELATWIGDAGSPVYEIWNEPDAETFWGGQRPDAAAYTEMLRASYAAVKRAAPGARVLAGPTTGNNFGWIEQLYANGAKGSFDGVAVHTDTACSVASPDTFYRDENGRVGQYTFLGFREVRATMLANGDDKPIWMSEIGWQSTTAVCRHGVSAGNKPEGVTEAEQAAFLTKGFQCLAGYPYIASAAWFTLRDAPGHHYGLLRSNGTEKPSAAAFRSAGAQGPTACGDFEPPSINVVAPAVGQQFVGRIDLRAAASDAGVGLSRLSYTYDGGKRIGSFGDTLTNGGIVGLAPWYGSSELPLGPHTIEVTAHDKNGNTSVRTVPVTRVATLAQTLIPKFKVPGKATCRKAKRGPRYTTCTFAGTLSRGPGNPTIGGKVAIDWEFRNKKGQYRKFNGGMARASKRFAFRAVLKRKGAWRVRVVYQGAAPYKAVKTKYLYFKVR